MKKLLFVLLGGAGLFAGCILYILGTNKIVEDQYVGMSIGQIVEYLGEPGDSGEKDITEGYRPYEIEPDYEKYFSKTELSGSVKIKILRWNKGLWIIIAWLKTDGNVWRVFSSLEYPRGVNF